MKRAAPTLSTSQALLIMAAASLLANGYLISLLTYVHDTGQSSQKSLFQLVQSQGNLSVSQRNELINQFAGVADKGGFATHQDMLALNNILLGQSLGQRHTVAASAAINASNTAHEILKILQNKS